MLQKFILNTFLRLGFNKKLLINVTSLVNIRYIITNGISLFIMAQTYP